MKSSLVVIDAYQNRDLIADAWKPIKASSALCPILQDRMAIFALKLEEREDVIITGNRPQLILG